jgi:AcrR family transcriptional regulator
MQKQKRTGRVSKAEWLAAALEELEKGGIDAVRVERLGKLLSVAKSGFYWHFKDRRDLHLHLLDYWFHEYTAVVTANPLLHQGDPKSRLEKIMAMVEDNDLAKYETAIRAWAEHDEMAGEVVQDVTKARLDFIRPIFAELGFNGDELEARTMVFVCYETWESSIFRHMSARKRKRLRKRRLDLLTTS